MSFLDDAADASQIIAQMIEAARAGASEALRSRVIGLKAQAKSEADGDIVTQGDKASQAAIFAVLPDQWTVEAKQQAIGFYAEEAMHEGYIFPEKAQWRWCVDPIDGTKPYYNGDYCWSVSIALQQRAGDDWQSVIAAIYRVSDEDKPEHLCGHIYWAIAGKGAYRLALTSGEQSKIETPQAIAAIAECESNPEVATPEAQAYATHALQILNDRNITHGWRRSICYAACELLDGQKAAVVQGVAGPFDWDIAAIMLITAEAGIYGQFAPRVSFAEGWRYPAIMAWDKALFDQLTALPV
jgi:fructose-1,6-bisphosphatase/inositol monophosphatase family enzyme